MCQLTLVNIDDVLLEKLFCNSLAVINADRGNKDGFGCVLGNKIFRTVNQPSSLTVEHIHLIKGLSEPEPILMHVRSASIGIKVTLENVHPFKFSNLIGMHNGTLYFPDEQPTYSRTTEESRESDSKRFFETLNKNYNGNMVESLQKTMKEITGKFAFLIKDTKTKKIYVVRGKTAQLHYTNLLDEEGSVMGIVVNTDKFCLERAINYTGVFYTLLTQRTLVYTSPISEVDEESIFELNGFYLTKVGELKENPVVYKSTAVVPAKAVNNIPYLGSSSRILDTVSKGVLFSFVELFTQTGMYIDDLDILSNAVFGKVFAELDMEDFRLLNVYVLPKLVISNNLTKKITNITGMFPNRHDLVQADLQFPIGINKVPEILSKLKTYQKELDKKFAKAKA